MGNENNSTVDYGSVLADLKAKRDQLNTAIAAIEQLQGLAPSVAVVGVGGVGSQVEDALRDDSFFQMSIPDAARKFLAMKKKPMSTPEIANALKAGGVTTLKPDSFANTVGSVLNRSDKNDAGIVKVGRGKWGLAEWYPGRKRKKNTDAEEEAPVQE